MFTEKNAHMLRHYLAQRVPEVKSYYNPEVSVMVVNAADQCALTCPNCLFSAAMAKKVFNGDPPRITMTQIQNFVKVMNEAKAELLVFSGGGESYENMDVMCYAVENLKNIRDVVTITSAYFATTEETTSLMLDKFIEAIRRGNKMRGRDITFTLRISYDTFHNVPVENIVNVIKYALSRSGDGVHIRPIIRTILDPAQNLDLVLAKMLSAKLLPEKDPLNPIANLPIIDAFPTRWIVNDNMEIPVIYKPTYFLGFAKKISKQDIPGTSWRDVKKAEEIGDSFFNLSMRGGQGEGHNFYETILLGYSYWMATLNKATNYNTPRTSHCRKLSVYLPASGKMIINASSPDSWKPVESIPSWQDYWETISSDVLQLTATTQPTDILINYAREVEPNIEKLLDERNFVFQIAYTAMETAALRLYVTIRLLQNHAAHGVQFKNTVVHELISMNKSELVDAYNMARRLKITKETSTSSRYLVTDPIVGNQLSIWVNQNNFELYTFTSLKELLEWNRKEGSL